MVVCLGSGAAIASPKNKKPRSGARRRDKVQRVIALAREGRLEGDVVQCSYGSS
jgi:hypothetical protein